MFLSKKITVLFSHSKPKDLWSSGWFKWKMTINNMEICSDWLFLFHSIDSIETKKVLQMERMSVKNYSKTRLIYSTFTSDPKRHINKTCVFDGVIWPLCMLWVSVFTHVKVFVVFSRSFCSVWPELQNRWEAPPPEDTTHTTDINRVIMTHLYWSNLTFSDEA